MLDPPIDSDDYHDYVFTRGRLVGRFEEMYQRSREVPWHQDRVAEEPDVAVLKAIVRQRSPYALILDVGCGLGHLARELTELGDRVYGVDISATAIRRLGERFPHICARVVDVASDALERPLFPDADQFNLVVCRGFFWYIFPRIHEVVRNVTSWVAPGGYLLLHQNFPPLESEFVGKDVIPTPQSLLDHFLDASELAVIYRNAFRDHSRGHGNDDWSTFLLQREQAVR